MINKNKSLDEMIAEVGLMLRSYQMEDARRFGLHGCMDQVLTMIKSKKKVAKTELADSLGISARSLDGCLARMDYADFIRASKENDIIYLELTEAGLKETELAERKREEMDKFFNCLSDADKASLRDILNQLADHLEKELKDKCDCECGGFWERRGFARFGMGDRRFDGYGAGDFDEGMFERRSFGFFPGKGFGRF